MVLLFSGLRQGLQQLILDILYYFVCMSVCLNLFIYTACVPGALGGQKRVLGALRLESQTGMRSHVDAGNQTQEQMLRTAQTTHQPQGLLFRPRFHTVLALPFLIMFGTTEK